MIESGNKTIKCFISKPQITSLYNQGWMVHTQVGTTNYQPQCVWVTTISYQWPTYSWEFTMLIHVHFQEPSIYNVFTKLPAYAYAYIPQTNYEGTHLPNYVHVMSLNPLSLSIHNCGGSGLQKDSFQRRDQNSAENGQKERGSTVEQRPIPVSTHRGGSGAPPLDQSSTSPHISGNVVSLSLSNHDKNIVLAEVQRLQEVSLVAHMEGSRPNRPQLRRMLYASFPEVLFSGYRTLVVSTIV